LTEPGILLSAIQKGETTTIDAKRIGPPFLFERLWRDSFCRSVIEDLLAGRKFEFPLERAVFLTVLHRIMDPGSDRAAEKWRLAYSISGMDAIDLHHLYRAMAWLGEELAEQQGSGLVPRANKDLIEEQLFAKRRNLFNDVGLAIFDTTSLYFEGDGGTTLGRHGHSKDSRPDLALLLRKELIDRLVAAGRQYEWGDVDHLVQTDVDQAGRRLRLRAAAPGCAGAVFQAVGVALPPMIQITAQPPPASAAQPILPTYRANVAGSA
jgi:hypothetical protein